MKKRLIAILAAMLVVLSLSASAFAAPTDGKTLRHSVALIEVGIQTSNGTWEAAQWGAAGERSRGTGFFIGRTGEDPQYLITNRHVIDYYLQMEQGETLAVTQNDELLAYARAQIRVYFDYDSRDYLEASVVEAGSTDSKDYAILKLEKPTSKRAPLPICLPTEEMSDPNKKVYIVGFPGVDTSEALLPTHMFREEDASIDVGTIVKLFTQTGTLVPTIQFSQAINPGNSGGPLVYQNGAAIGITTWSYAPSSANAPRFYAVSMELVKPVLDRNNIPYTLIDADDDGTVKQTISTDDPVVIHHDEPKTDTQWLVYVILGVAILGVAVVLIVLLRKPAISKKPDTDSKTPDSGKVTDKSGTKKPDNTKKSRVLVALEGPLKGDIYPLEVGKKLYIGRDPKRCKVLFKEGTGGVSAIHCMIKFDGNVVTIKDEGSTYGTMVDGKKLPANQPQTLHRGHPIDIGSSKIRFVLR